MLELTSYNWAGQSVHNAFQMYAALHEMEVSRAEAMEDISPDK
jgi:hypothetical protein